MKYRADIDGMRCLAVLSVFLYHLNNNLLPGGYTGVDIFFVISGFLITRIIVTEIRNNSFSMARFYSRRMRRIFPALFTMLFLSAGFAVISLSPEMYTRFFSEFNSAALQISNFMFAQERGYFDPATELSPLLHTWSLGVEEQFYLIWPLLLITVSRLKGIRLWPILTIIIISSLSYSDYLSTHSPQSAFFMLHSRAWELGVGGLLALCPLPALKSQKTINSLSFLGLVCILLPMFTLNSSVPFPGRNAIFSVFGVALLIYSGGLSNNSIAYRLLSLRPFVAIGVISYSLYLWHWPIIVFYKATANAEITFFSGSCIFAAALTLSTASFFLIERPCRYGKLPESLTAYITEKKLHTNLTQRYSLVIVALLFLPMLAVSAINYTTKIDANHSATTLTIDVEVKPENFNPETEMIAVYWSDSSQPFSEKDSKHLLYSPTYQLNDTQYRFTFLVPALSQINRVRIDPLIDKGEVWIRSCKITSGVLPISKYLNLSSITEQYIYSAHNLTAQLSANGVHLTATGKDPHTLLLADNFYKYYEMFLLFCILLCVSVWVILTVNLMRRQRFPEATLSAGATFIVITLILSMRLGFSSHSFWRFLNDEEAGAMFHTVRYTDIKQIPQTDSPEVILMGDSHAANYAQSVYEWSESQDLSLKIIAQPACPPIFHDEPKPDGNSLLKKQYHSCMQRHKTTINQAIENPQIQFVFLAFRAEFYVEHPKSIFNNRAASQLTDTYDYSDILTDALADTVNTLLNSGKKVIILEQVPILREQPQKCMTRNITLISSLFNITPSCEMDKEFSNKKISKTFELYSKLPQDNRYLYYFDPGKYITSVFDDEKQTLYYDDNHLNHLGSEKLSPFFQDEMSHFLANISHVSYLSSNGLLTD